MKSYTVTKPYFPDKSEFQIFLDQIWENQYLTNNGPLHREFEQQLKTYLDCANLTLTVNGHSALDIAIKGLELSGEVITTPFTFASTTHALTLNNLTPVFCDIKESDLTIDESKIESLITDQTSAILPVHVYGHMCNIGKIAEIAKRHHLKVIYDAAHTFGVKYQNCALANYGDVSMLSFHATKIFHTIEGGALIYDDNSKKQIFETLKNFGIEGEEIIDFIGGNAKMNEFQAAMGLINLNHIDELIVKRKSLTLHYRELLDRVPDLHYFVPEEIYQDFTYNYSYFPILTSNRDALYDYLKTQNIFTRKYFYPLIPDFGCYKDKFGQIKIPVARKTASEVLCLPLYNGLSHQDIDYIASKIIEFKQSEVTNHAES